MVWFLGDSTSHNGSMYGQRGVLEGMISFLSSLFSISSPNFRPRADSIQLVPLLLFLVRGHAKGNCGWRHRSRKLRNVLQQRRPHTADTPPVPPAAATSPDQNQESNVLFWAASNLDTQLIALHAVLGSSDPRTVPGEWNKRN